MTDGQRLKYLLIDKKNKTEEDRIEIKELAKKISQKWRNGVKKDGDTSRRKKKR